MLPKPTDICYDRGGKTAARAQPLQKYAECSGARDCVFDTGSGARRTTVLPLKTPCYPHLSLNAPLLRDCLRHKGSGESSFEQRGGKVSWTRPPKREYGRDW